MAAPAQRSEPAGPAALLGLLAARGAAARAQENFPVALRVLPAVPRAQLAAVYSFARLVDDIGDEACAGPTPLTPTLRLALLDTVADSVRAVADAGPTGAVPEVDALAPLLDRRVAGPQPFLDLVEANRRDQVVHSYATFDDLVGYCHLSAVPVGRIVLALAGRAADRTAVALSDGVCTALQVLEHCQDVREDALAGRVYLPADDLARHGVAAADLTAAVAGPGLRRVVALEAARARALLRDGAALVARLRGWPRPAVAGYVAGGLATADALRAADHDVLRAPVRPRATRVAGHAVALLGASLLRPRPSRRTGAGTPGPDGDRGGVR